MQGLPVSSYLDPARATLEAANIFASTWQFVCHDSDLPATGTAVRFDCAGRSAVVLRARSGELHAFRNACRHRGARLVEGDPHTGLAFCVDGRLRCPYHGWAYDDCGALASVPTEQQFDPDLDLAAHSLHVVYVAQWRGLVFIAFEKPAWSLPQSLDDAASGWPDFASLRRLIEPRSVACAADWKLAAEHLLDASHLDVARPGLKPRVFGAPAFAQRNNAALHGIAPLAAATSGERWSARTYRTLLRTQDPDRTTAAALFVWPNLLLQHAPDGLTALQVLPGPAAACTYREWRYGVPDGSRATRLLRYVHHRVRRQALAADVRLLSRVQQGMANLAGSEAGPIARNETGMQWFLARYRESIADTAAVLQPAVSKRRTRSRAALTAGN